MIPANHLEELCKAISEDDMSVKEYLYRILDK